MSADPSLPIQKAIVAALSGTTDAGVNVFDQVPTSPAPEGPFPRITIGEGQSAGNYADCYDGTETTLVVDVWSRAVGFPEAKRIASQVRAILHDATLVLDDHTLDLITFQNAVNLRDPDGITRHVALAFRLLTHPAEPPMAASTKVATKIVAATGSSSGFGA